MYGEKAFELIKQFDRNKDTINPYNKDLIGEINAEICELIEENQKDARLNESSRNSGGPSCLSTILLRHTAIQRNIRCLLAYHYHRLTSLNKMRWEFGNTIPSDIKDNLSQAESDWFTNYSNNLGKYMRSIGENGLNLAVDYKPPKSLYIEVRCLVDYGHFELNDGSVIFLKKNTRHFLPRNECEEMIKQGVFEHITE